MWVAAHDERTPVAAKAVAMVTVAYALSPIDLIPDFIPVLGLLDDLVLVPAGIWLAIRLIPPELFEEFRETAAQMLQQPRSRSITALLPVMLVWLTLAAIAGWLLWP